MFKLLNEGQILLHLIQKPLLSMFLHFLCDLTLLVD